MKLIFVKNLKDLAIVLKFLVFIGGYGKHVDFSMITL